MNRGDHPPAPQRSRQAGREAIFEDDEDRQRLLETLTGACEKTGWQAHAYCLMRNHFHLVIETPQPNLVAGMKWLLGTYTRPEDNVAGRAAGVSPAQRQVPAGAQKAKPV